MAFLVFIGFRYLNQIVYKLSKTSNVASIELTNSVVEGMRTMYLAATANTGYLIKHDHDRENKINTSQILVIQ